MGSSSAKAMSRSFFSVVSEPTRTRHRPSRRATDTSAPANKNRCQPAPSPTSEGSSRKRSQTPTTSSKNAVTVWSASSGYSVRQTAAASEAASRTSRMLEISNSLCAEHPRRAAIAKSTCRWKRRSGRAASRCAETAFSHFSAMRPR